MMCYYLSVQCQGQVVNLQVSSCRKQQALNNAILRRFVLITRHANRTLFAPHCDRIYNTCLCVCVCPCRIFRNYVVNSTILRHIF